MSPNMRSRPGIYNSPLPPSKAEVTPLSSAFPSLPSPKETKKVKELRKTPSAQVGSASCQAHENKEGSPLLPGIPRSAEGPFPALMSDWGHGSGSSRVDTRAPGPFDHACLSPSPACLFLLRDGRIVLPGCVLSVRLDWTLLF